MSKEDPIVGATRWFINLMTAADVNELWPQFEEWLEQDASNRRAYEELERTWTACYPLPAVLH
jgi:ferric-dicitrate binding protein FerR (iron transport regulator)